MYGSRGYGTSGYGSIAEEKPLVTVHPSVLPITATLHAPKVNVTEIVDFLGITATLHAPQVTANDKSIIVKVNSVDISNQIDFTSLDVSNNLYSDPDTASFEILRSSSKSYTPSAGDEITVEDTGVLIFSGILIKIKESTLGFSNKYALEFKDWTEELGTILVAETYVGETVEDIIADIFTDGNLSDYDGTTNVSDTTVISNISFDNIPVVDALDQLAGLSGKHWYVSPEQDIYFFASSEISAPFDLTDNNGKYYYSSLKVDEDLTQIRNVVTVKGKGIAAVTVQDATSISTYGRREYFNRDDEIDATNEATQKANAILASFKDPIKIATFETLTEGLFSGQQIDVVSALRGINETLNIEAVQFRSKYENRFSYLVKATSQRLGGIDDLWTEQVNKPDTTTPSVGDQGNLQDIEFTAIDDETIQWSSGTIRLADGTVYNISANAAQALTADHVIYFDPNVSLTVLQISTTFSDGIGSNKIPLAYATKSGVATKGADIFPVTFGGKIQIDGGTHITDNSIITDNLAANSVTIAELSVVQLSGISADLGTITAGTVTGAILQTASTGFRAKLSSLNGIQFLNGATQKGRIRADTGDTIVFDTVGNYQFFVGLDSVGVWNIDGITLASSKSLGFSGGSTLTDTGAELGLDRRLNINGNLITKKIFLDDLEAAGPTFEYNSANDGSDMNWESVGNVRMKCNQDGNVTADGSFTGGGADFAEMFESIDGKKIHAGISVVVDNGRIREAKKGESPIGVISANPTIIGNAGGSDADDNWKGKYIKDDFGNYIMEEKEWWIVNIKKRNRNKIEKESNWSDIKKPPKSAKTKMAFRRKLNPDFDDSIEYKPRKERKEWCVVGLIGIVPIIKGQIVSNNWIKLRNISDNVEEYLIR